MIYRLVEQHDCTGTTYELSIRFVRNKKITITKNMKSGGNKCDDFSDNTHENNIGQKTKRLQILSVFQILYYIMFNGRKKTPLQTLLGQTVHDVCKSKTLISRLNHLGISVSYDEVFRHQTYLTNYTINTSSAVLPLPSHFDPKSFTVAAFHNVDHEEAMLSGLSGCHDTVSVLFHDKPEVSGRKPMVSTTTVKHGPRTVVKKIPCQEVAQFIKPDKRSYIPVDYNVRSKEYVMNEASFRIISLTEFAWILLRTDVTHDAEEDIHIPEHIISAWKDFNHFVTKEDITQKIVGFLPVLPQPVTQYDTVDTALKNVQCVRRQLN